MQYHTVSQDHTGRNLPVGGQGEQTPWHTVHDRPPTSGNGSRLALPSATIKPPALPIVPRPRPTARVFPPAWIPTLPTSGPALSRWPTGSSTRKKNPRRRNRPWFLVPGRASLVPGR